MLDPRTIECVTINDKYFFSGVIYTHLNLIRIVDSVPINGCLGCTVFPTTYVGTGFLHVRTYVCHVHDYYHKCAEQ